MLERFHVVLGLVGLGAGLVVLLLDRVGPPASRSRSLALAGAVAPLLCVGDTDRWPVWFVAAALLLLTPDRGVPPHPLGRWTVPAAVVGLGGAWLAVPDTEPVVATVGLFLPLAVDRFLRRLAPGPTGSLVLVVAVLGAVWVGSAGRGAALAAVCAAGVVAVLPVVVGMGRHRIRDGRTGWVLAGYLTVVVTVPRLASGLGAAAAWAVAAAATLLLVVIGRWSRLPQEAAGPDAPVAPG